MKDKVLVKGKTPRMITHRQGRDTDISALVTFESLEVAGKFNYGGEAFLRMVYGHSMDLTLETTRQLRDILDKDVIPFLEQVEVKKKEWKAKGKEKK